MNDSVLDVDQTPRSEISGLSETTSGAVTPETVRRLSEGDHEAYETIYLHYVNPLLRFMAKFTGSYEEGEEVVQDVFVRLWGNRHRVDPTRNIKSFLFTIARNAALDRIKKKHRFSDVADYDTDAGGGYIADEKMIAKDTRLLIEIAVGNMPRNRREVFRMHQEGLSYSEIAQRLNISVDNAQQYVSRARKDIKEILTLILFFFIP